MRQHITARSGLVLVSIFVASLSAKGLPTRITIGGTSLATPIDIKDPAVLARFDIWAGPGTRSAGVEDSEGFIIDWRSGAVAAPPEALQRYRVSFFVKYRDGQEEQLAYVVSYAYDPSTEQGYVYLPGKGDQEYVLNTTSIRRGREGHWFKAAATWQGVIKPLLAPGHGPATF